MGYSRHTIYTRHPFVPTPKARGIYGKGEDAGKWFKCRFCGWPCNFERDALGDGVGYTVKDAPVLNTWANEYGEFLSSIIVVRTIEDAVTIDEDDTITEYTRNQYTQPTTGCPNCGSKNWK